MIFIKKKYLILTTILIIIITLTISILYIFTKNKKEKTSNNIKGTILVVGSDYLLVSTQEENDYIINTKDVNYNIGDIIKLEINNLDTTKNPYEATAKSILLISKNNDNIPTNEEPKNNENTLKEDNNQTNQKDDSNEEIITYFENLDTELTNYNNDETLGNKIKSKFISCIDFIFYDKEINGITFKDLTNKTKLKILEITLSIDSKIDSKFPNYKETIGSTYQDIKNKTIEKYLNITTTICSNDEKLCKNAKESFQNIKNNFGITWNLIKTLIGNSSTKLKEWYEIWKYN